MNNKKRIDLLASIAQETSKDKRFKEIIKSLVNNDIPVLAGLYTPNSQNRRVVVDRDELNRLLDKGISPSVLLAVIAGRMNRPTASQNGINCKALMQNINSNTASPWYRERRIGAGRKTKQQCDQPRAIWTHFQE